MAKCNKTFNLIASKIGLGDEDKVLSKASEFERLLQTKSTAGSNITDTSKLVICLDLAANLLGAEFDVKQAIKYSGLKPSLYANSKKIISNLLEFNNDILSVPIVCAALQCTNAQELAENILEQYRRDSKLVLDMNLPQYVCMAVYQACRISKIKLSKSKVTEKAKLKPAQWSKLEADWSKYVDEHFTAAKKKTKKNTKIATEEVETPEPMELEMKDEAETFEPYDQWKKRMIETAYAELRELEKTECLEEIISPRRSPRKTPQKHSPYKSTDKKGGIRLLFPV